MLQKVGAVSGDSPALVHEVLAQEASLAEMASAEVPQSSQADPVCCIPAQLYVQLLIWDGNCQP